jgi:SAM-dependent methyltransferase
MTERIQTIEYWDENARWQRLWLEHNDYHSRIIDVLKKIARPGWRVLDIGGGAGVLAMALDEIGCTVTVIEPSRGMRELLFEAMKDVPEGRVEVDERRWEDILPEELGEFNLIVACNSLHVTQPGFHRALKRVFQTGSEHVFIVTERPGRASEEDGEPRGYLMVHSESYETESSYAYQDNDEAIEHWTFKLGRELTGDERSEILDRLCVDDHHLLLPGKADVHLYHWERDT